MELIKVKNVTYSKYEEVLLRRDKLRKEAENYHLEFIRVFGDLIIESFKLKIECIRKKKMIAYCQRLVNQGKVINNNELIAFIEKEMQDYQAELEDIVESVKIVREAEKVSPFDMKKIKELYHSLAKLIHPDIHPELAGDPILEDYWYRIVIAYNYNNLKELEELDLLVRKYLNDKDMADLEINIEDISEKIQAVEAEIDVITSTNPYLYRILLNDRKETEEKKQEYKEEIESFKKYSAQLDEVLSTFEIKEMLS